MQWHHHFFVAFTTYVYRYMHSPLFRIGGAGNEITIIPNLQNLYLFLLAGKVSFYYCHHCLPYGHRWKKELWGELEVCARKKKNGQPKSNLFQETARICSLWCSEEIEKGASLLAKINFIHSSGLIYQFYDRRRSHDQHNYDNSLQWTHCWQRRDMNWYSSPYNILYM